jgi:uncharacterized membrane protein YdjX (TVP38/TMEM64 family)
MGCGKLDFHGITVHRTGRRNRFALHRPPGGLMRAEERIAAVPPAGVTTARRRSGRVILAGGLGVLMLFGIAAMRLWPGTVVGTAEQLMSEVRGLGGIGLIAFGALQAFVAVSGVLPASLLGIAAGAVYGLVPGFLLAAVSTLAGAVLAFLISRSAFRPAVEGLCARRPRLRNLDALIAQDGWKLVCLLRVNPVMPFSATSYVLGLSSIGMGEYLVGTLASLPALLGYVFLGTLADASLSALATGAGPFRWVVIGVDGITTLALTIHLGSIVARLGSFGGEAPGGGAGQSGERGT